MKTISSILTEIGSNNVARTFVLMHLGAAIAILLLKPVQHGFGYNFNDEPIYYQALYIIDYPAILITGLLFYPFISADTSSTATIWSYYAALLIISSLQWAVIGYLISRLWNVRDAESVD